jgi:hypothetical protein
MSAGSNPCLGATVGSVQQKVAMAAYNRHISRVAPEVKSAGVRQIEGSLAAQEAQDSATISREGIAALETSQEVGDEAVIRDGQSAKEVLAYAKEQIVEQGDRAIRAQANQTASQVLALYKE